MLSNHYKYSSLDRWLSEVFTSCSRHICTINIGVNENVSTGFVHAQVYTITLNMELQEVNTFYHAHGLKKMWGRYDFFTIITFILQGCIKLIKFNSKTFNNVTTDLYFIFF